MRRVFLVMAAALILTGMASAAGNGATVSQTVIPQPDAFGDRGIEHKTLTPSGELVVVWAGSGTDPQSGLPGKGVVVTKLSEGAIHVSQTNILFTYPDGTTTRLIVHMVDGRIVSYQMK